jgi:Bacterial Ig domain
MSNLKHLHLRCASAQVQVSQISKKLRVFVVPVLAVIGLALALAGSVLAQEGELRLSLRKDWGFGMGNQIQGLFTMSVNGEQDISSVNFELDGDAIATVTQPPFKFQFNTDRYPHGRHSLNAIARTSDGRTIKSNVINVEFVSAEAGWQVAQRIMIPLFVVVGIAIVLGTLGQFVFSGRSKHRLEPGAPRNYGIVGGAICPKCRRPFALNLFGLNLVTRKLERCPYCGKWSLVSRASREALAAAEAAEVEASQPAVPEPNPEEKLRQQIEESRYQ